MSTSAGGSRHLWAVALALAAAYAISGRLGLLLAIPPGYATAVWPASGVALAGVLRYGPRVAPGICLGSFLINVWTSFDFTGNTAVLNSLLLPALIALGATLQALVGAAWIHRFVGYTNILTQEVDVLRMLFLGGPLACLLSASIGVTGLWLAGKVTNSELLFNWWTWWVGDSIGVLVFAPVVLVWFTRPYRLWWRRQLTATLPLLVLFSVVVLAFVLASQREQARMRAEFEAGANQAAQRFSADFDRYLVALAAVEGFFVGSEHVTSAEFQSFSGRLLATLPGLYAVGWDELVPTRERPAFEARMRAEGEADFALTERDASGKTVPVGERPYYVPVTYARYAGPRVKAVGYDMASEATRRHAFEQAAQSGRATATGRVRLVSDPEPGYDVLVLLPVRLPATPGRISGYAGLAVRASAIMRAAMQGVDPEIVGRLLDLSAPAGQNLLNGPDRKTGDAQSLRHTVNIQAAGRVWQLEFVAPNAYLAAHRSWAPWTVLAAGLLLTALLGVLLLVMVGRSTKVELLVGERARELAVKNAQLRQREEEMRRTLAALSTSEALLRSTADELTASNSELEQFAYIASHDLQGPLRGVAGFAQLLQLRYHDKLDTEGKEFLDFINKGCQQMQALVRDLLDLSRVGKVDARFSTRPLAETIAEARAALSVEIAAARAWITCGPLPKISADHSLLGQLFQNLISNAIKFQKPGSQALVHISAVREGDDWLVRITDNGIGIPDKQLDNIFAIFRRLHRQEEFEGTGIGLAICRKIAQHHGGSIRAVAHQGGACFELRLPATLPQAHNRLLA